MTRQQRRYLDREMTKIAEGLARVTMKKDADVVDHNHIEFLKSKAVRIRRLNNESHSQTSEG